MGTTNSASRTYMKNVVLVIVALASMMIIGQRFAFADTDTDYVLCSGTGGYGESGTWSFRNLSSPYQINTPIVGYDTGFFGRACGILSPDNLPSAGTPPSPTIPPTVPMPPSVDPNDPVGIVFAVIDTLCTPEPSLCSYLTQLLLGFIFSLGPAEPATMSLTATGDLSCGNGTLSGTGFINPAGGEPSKNLAWSATFTNGTGTVTGTATGVDESGVSQVWTLGGTMLIADGALPGQSTITGCDDSAGRSGVLVNLTIAP